MARRVWTVVSRRGEVTGIWDDRLNPRRLLNARPSRASRIEPDGPDDRFVVDFSPYADATDDDRFRVCLVQTFLSYDAARDAEVVFLGRVLYPPEKDSI